MMIAQGSSVALVTPMKDTGEVDFLAFERLIQFHIDEGTENIIVAGTTGEASTLTSKEHVEVIEYACNYSDQISIIAGTGSNSTRQTIDLSKAVEYLPIKAFLIVVPYYNKPTQRGLIEHFTIIADSLKKPIILYNVPGRTVVNMTNETIIELAKHSNIIGIKEASGDVSRLEEINLNTPDDFVLLSGDDESCMNFMLAGGHGCISVTANVAPRQMRTLCDLSVLKDDAKAKDLDNLLQPLHKAMFTESNPIPVKAALSIMGMIENNIRLPLTPHDAKLSEGLRLVLKNLKIIE
jgi:4-hydroxy-tetrahydrodipicolinate synthase